MRLDKLLAHMGFGSRKEVRATIRKGRVHVNGEVVRTHGKHVDHEADIVTINGEEVYYREHIYLMLNKPQGYISATEDTYQRTVIDLLTNDYKIFDPFPVGRLDKDTEGLLLLTNDGQLTHQLTSPHKGIEKVYEVEVEGKVTSEDIHSFKRGIRLDDGYQTKPATLIIDKSDHISEVKLTITEGKFHQVKRMFLAIGKKVIFLKRIRMGAISLDDSLSPGEYRELNDAELAYCKELTS